MYWDDFEKTTHEYLKENTIKFYAFSVVVRCKLNDEDINNSVDSGEGYALSYKLPDSGWICYKDRKSKKYEIMYFIVLC